MCVHVTVNPTCHLESIQQMCVFVCVFVLLRDSCVRAAFRGNIVVIVDDTKHKSQVNSCDRNGGKHDNTRATKDMSRGKQQ